MLIFFSEQVQSPSRSSPSKLPPRRVVPSVDLALSETEASDCSCSSSSSAADAQSNSTLKSRQSPSRSHRNHHHRQHHHHLHVHTTAEHHHKSNQVKAIVTKGKKRKHPITIAYGYRARGSDVRHIFYSTTSSSSSSSPSPPPSSWFQSASPSATASSGTPVHLLPWSERRRIEDALARQREKKRRANEWEWLFASAAHGAFDSHSRSRSSRRRRDVAAASEIGQDELDGDEEWPLGSDADDGDDSDVGDGYEFGDDNDDDEGRLEGDSSEDVMDFELDMFSITPSDSSHQEFITASAHHHPHNTSVRQPLQPPASRNVNGTSSPSHQLGAALVSGEREFSSRNRKTKRAAFYRGRSASPLPRPPAWLGTSQQQGGGGRAGSRSPSPSRSSSARSATSWNWRARGEPQHPSRPIRHPALVPSTRHSSSSSSSTSSSSAPNNGTSPSPILARKRMFYTDTRFFRVYALENSIRLRLLSIEGEKGDELRASGALGWSGSRAVKMVRRERVRGYGTRAGAGARNGRSLLSEAFSAVST